MSTPSSPSASRGHQRPANPFLKTPFEPAHQVAICVFLDKILPALPQNVICSEVVDSMKCTGNKHTQRAITLQGRWRGFAQDPAVAPRWGKASFKHLASVVDAIVKSSRLNLDTSSRFQNNTKCSMKYANRRDETLPDAFVVCGPEVSWDTMAVCGEYKRTDSASEVRDNIMKITSSITNCMRLNPRRRFSFGFTIENVMMKLWYCDRSQMLVSEPFNFVTDHEYLVHFFLSVLYAEPHQLGWDSTMAPRPDGLNYNITVHSMDGESRVYRTLELLSDAGTGVAWHFRGTRIWKAVRVKGGEERGSPVVLKDSWVDTDGKLEGNTVQLMRTMETSSSESDAANQFFLSVQWHGYVLLNEEERTSDRTRLLNFKDSTTDDASSNISQHVENDKPRPNRHRCIQLVHYRVIFEEVCRPLEQESSLSTIFTALANATRALQIMHRAGWVHRDVSAGNVLLCDQGTGSRLVDLEYAKEVSEKDSDNEFRVGTMYYMAVEVDQQCRMFLPQGEPPELPEDTPDLYDIALGLVSESKIPLIQISDRPLTSPQFRYNPLHDLESLWWIAVYFILEREAHYDSEEAASDTQPGDPDSWNPNAQRAFAKKIFYSRAERFDIIETQGHFSRRIDVVHPCVRPVALLLEYLRRALVTYYLRTEEDVESIDHKSADGLHEVFTEVFLTIASTNKFKDVKLRPLRRPAQTNGPNQEDPHAAAQSKVSMLRRRSRTERDEEECDDAHERDSRPEKPSKILRTSLRSQVIGAEVPSRRYNLRPRPIRH